MKYLFAVALILSCAGLVCAQQSQKSVIAEVKHTAPAAAAPRECLLTFRDFFRYLQNSESFVTSNRRNDG